MKRFVKNYYVHNEELIVWEVSNNARTSYEVYNAYWEETMFKGTYKECLEFLKDYRVKRLQELAG